MDPCIFGQIKDHMKYEKTIYESVSQQIETELGTISMVSEFMNGELTDFQFDVDGIDPKNVEHLLSMVQFLNRTISLFK